MPKNLNLFERIARIVAGSILLFLSFAVFAHPVAKLLIILAGMWLLLEGILARCPMYHGLGVKKPGLMRKETAMSIMVAGAQAAIGYVWWHAGWTKIWDGGYVGSLPGFLERCANGNHFWFMRNVILNQGVRYHAFLGGLVELLQYAIGIGLIVLAYLWLTSREERTRRAALYFSAIALACGTLMSMVSYFAAGPLDSAIAAGSAVMFWVQLVMVYGFVNILMSKER